MRIICGTESLARRGPSPQPFHLPEYREPCMRGEGVRARRRREIVRASAYTLIEMVMALGILVIILAAAESAVMLTAKAIPDGRGPAAAAISAERVQDLLASEVMSAISVS